MTAISNDQDVRSIVVERELPHPPEKIWRALTQPHLIQEWLMDNDFQPIVGHRFTFVAPPAAHWNGVTDCEVLEVEPNRTLSYSWNSSGARATSTSSSLPACSIDRLVKPVLRESWGTKHESAP